MTPEQKQRVEEIISLSKEEIFYPTHEQVKLLVAHIDQLAKENEALKLEIRQARHESEGRLLMYEAMTKRYEQCHNDRARMMTGQREEGKE